MLYYFYGKDKFLTELEADKKIREFVDQGLKKIILESIEDLKQAVKSNSLFSEKKVFVFVTEKPNEAEKKQFQVLKFSEDQSFVFVEKSATPTLLFGKQKVDKIKSGEVDAKWLKQQAKEFSMDLKKDLMDYWLSDQFKDCDAGYFYFEMMKLSLYRSNHVWGLADYLEISQSKQEISYFDWIKAVLEKNTAKALGFAPSDIGEALMRLKSLINIFEILLVAEDPVLINNLSTALVAGQKEFLVRNNPYWVRNLRQWATKMSYQEKEKNLEQLLNFEIMIKTGKLGAAEAIKLFVID